MNVPSGTQSDATPLSAYLRDKRALLLSGAGIGLVLAFISGVIACAVGLLTDGALSGFRGFSYGFGIGFLAGFIVALMCGPLFSAGLRLSIAVVALWVTGQRVRFIPLLDSAMKRQVLRQAGMVYQFRHADLQDRLAAHYRQEHSLTE